MHEPSAALQSLLDTFSRQHSTSAAMRATMQRHSEFSTTLQAQLTGITLDPHGRDLADHVLDEYWSNEGRQLSALLTSRDDREIIIGSGVHAAAYAAVRVLSGYPAPLILERDERAGGTFAMTAHPTFYLNSRNRAGKPGIAGDLQANPNYLAGAPIQATHLSMTQFPTNADMALVVRLALAQFAEVITNAKVVAVSRDGDGAQIDIDGHGRMRAGRIIDARGLGDPNGEFCDGITVLTFAQFLQRMTLDWPLRGVRRAAVIGGGDSARCAVESLLGIAPLPAMAVTALDQVDSIDWYAESLPTTCEQWQQRIRGRYQAIGRFLRPDGGGSKRLSVHQRRARPIALPGMALIDGRGYDLVISCTGYSEIEIDGLRPVSFSDYAIPQSSTAGEVTVVAGRHYDMPVFRVGPHARLPFNNREVADGIATIRENAISIFRTVSKTAALAATLPATQA